MRARCRDEIRNNPWAASACDNAESQWVGNGIKPHWHLPDNPTLKAEIERKFSRWAKSVEFYVKQATAAREIFESGEVFTRLHIRPSSWEMPVPLDLELYEGEQCPVFLNTISGGQPSTPSTNSIRTGIEMDQYKRIAAYHFYKQHPGETMFYPLDGLTYMRVPASSIVHTFKPLRAGLLRGQPHLASVLTLLHGIGKYSDAAVVKKLIQTMFAGFISKVDAVGDMLPIDTTSASGGGEAPYQASGPSPNHAVSPGVQASRIETGTMQELLPGESITFPTLPQDNDLEQVMRVWLHEFAVGCGATYEQITGDLKGVNLSSIRAGILDFRRKCEQFQRNILITRFCDPIVCRWVKEAVIAGELKLPGYAADPSQYEDLTWSLPGWPWLDPVKDAEANQTNVRNGFTSREAVCAEAGEEAAVIDAQQVAEHEREDKLKLVYDTRPDKILLGREANPTVPESGDSEAESEVVTVTGKPHQKVQTQPKPKSKPNGKDAESTLEIVQ